MTTRSLPHRSWIFIILLYLALIYMPFIIARAISGDMFMKGDCYYYRAVIVSIVEDGDFQLENNVPDPLIGQLAVGQKGFVPLHSILMPLVSLPFYLLFETPGLLLFNILACMILIVLIFELNCLFFPRIIALITTLLYATATLLLDYTYNYSPDVFATALLLGGLYLILCGKYYWGTIPLALSIFAKIPNAALVGVILLYAVYTIWKGEGTKISIKDDFRKKLTTTLIMGAVFILANIPFAYSNYLFFGSPIITGYQRMAVAGPNGQVLIVDHVNKFNQPLFKGMYQVLFDIGNGTLLTNPVLILAFAGALLIKNFKAQDKIYWILAICLIQFFTIAKYDEWATSHFSNRFLMAFIVLSSVFTSNFLSYLSRKYSLEPQTQPTRSSRRRSHG